MNATHMTTEETQRNIARQLNDIISQSERIISSRADIESLESFSKYSAELKAFLRDHSTNEMVVERLDSIPLIDMKSYYRTSMFAILGGWIGVGVYLRKQMIIARAMNDVRAAQAGYSSIQFLLKNEWQ